MRLRCCLMLSSTQIIHSVVALGAVISVCGGCSVTLVWLSSSCVYPFSADLSPRPSNLSGRPVSSFLPEVLVNEALTAIWRQCTSFWDHVSLCVVMHVYHINLSLFSIFKFATGIVNCYIYICTACTQANAFLVGWMLATASPETLGCSRFISAVYNSPILLEMRFVV